MLAMMQGGISLDSTGTVFLGAQFQFEFELCCTPGVNRSSHINSEVRNRNSGMNDMNQCFRAPLSVSP